MIIGAYVLFAIVVITVPTVVFIVALPDQADNITTTTATTTETTTTTTVTTTTAAVTNTDPSETSEKTEPTTVSTISPTPGTLTPNPLGLLTKEGIFLQIYLFRIVDSWSFGNRRYFARVLVSIWYPCRYSWCPKGCQHVHIGCCGRRYNCVPWLCLWETLALGGFLGAS